MALMKKNADYSILEARKIHENDVEIAENGCGALMNLAVNAKNKMALKKNKSAIATVRAAIKLHSDADYVQ